MQLSNGAQLKKKKKQGMTSYGHDMSALMLSEVGLNSSDRLWAATGVRTHSVSLSPIPDTPN